MGANIYPEDVGTIVYSDALLAKNVNSFSLSLIGDVAGNPKACFEFELLDIARKDEVEGRLQELLGSELAKLSADFKKAQDEYPQAIEPVIKLYGMHEGPFKENQTRIKKRYVEQSA